MSAPERVLVEYPDWIPFREENVWVLIESPFLILSSALHPGPERIWLMCSISIYVTPLQEPVKMMDPVCHVGASTNSSQFEVPEDMQHLGIGGIGIGDGHHNSFVNTLIYSQVS